MNNEEQNEEKNNDDWATPQWLFDKLDNEFNFTLDVCASHENAKCELYYTEVENCLVQDWNAKIFGGSPVSLHDLYRCCFMNPPYSNPRPFIEKAWEESMSVKVVCVVKVDTSTKWWGTFWDYDNHRPRQGCEIRFLPKRIKFDASPARIERARLEGKKLNGPTFPTAIIIMNRTGEENYHHG